jgi:hypothetical protein
LVDKSPYAQIKLASNSKPKVVTSEDSLNQICQQDSIIWLEALQFQVISQIPKKHLSGGKLD